MLEKHKAAITASLPRGFDNPDRMIRAAVNAISTTPMLAKCTPESLFISIVKGFSLGLEPNGVLAHGYLVPFKDKGVDKAQFMPGYRGLIELARRSGKVAEIYATEVHENDKFEVKLGTHKELVHEPNMFSNRGDILGWYAVFRLTDGSVDFEIMGHDEIDKIKRMSKAGNSNYSPWNSGHYNEMARKTVIKKLLKRCPMTVEAAKAVDDDNKAAMGEAQDTSDVIDIVGGQVEESPLEQAPSEAQEGADELDGLK
jgi:recombination protein RecT